MAKLGQTECAQLVCALDHVLREQVVRKWYPRAVDQEHAGFLTDLDHRFEPYGPQKKFVVTQARHTWVLARLASLYEAQAETYLGWASRGVAQLERHWDAIHGGFCACATRSGDPILGGVKTAYGNAFAIFALARFYQATADARALQMAQDAFWWLDERCYDNTHGGYFQYVTQNGKALVQGFGKYPPKDQNSSIHLLEAFVELYRVWPDPMLGLRLAALLELIAMALTAGGAYLRLFFTPEWRPVTYATVRDHDLDHVSFGHDVETAHLLIDAAEAVSAHQELAQRTARSMVNHALEWGWDVQRGGFFERGAYRDGRCLIIDDSKVWWAQFEALVALLQLSVLHVEDAGRYHVHFRMLWQYIQEYLLCPKYGSCYWAGLDTRPHHLTSPKAEEWKGNYHTVRGLSGAIDLLSAMHK